MIQFKDRFLIEWDGEWLEQKYPERFRTYNNDRALEDIGQIKNEEHKY